MSRDTVFLRRALQLAADNDPQQVGGPFGCVIVQEGHIIAEGSNRVLADCDPTAHAEVVAIRRAGRALGRWSLDGCTLYTSCEPCPMCLAAAYWARVDRIVFAASREDAADAGFDDAFLYREIPLPIDQRQLPIQRILEEEGREVFTAWKAVPGRVLY